MAEANSISAQGGPKSKGIIFDLFGTLVPNFSKSDPVLAEMAQAVGASPGEFAERWRGSFDDRALGTFPSLEANVEFVCGTLGIVAESDRIGESVKILSRFVARALSPRRDALQLLSALKDQGYGIGLISDCSIEVPDHLSMTSLAPLIDVGVFSCNEKMMKPEPRIYLLACERLGVSPSECFYIGDGSSGELTGAERVGMKAILFRDPDLDDAVVYRSEASNWKGPAISSFAELNLFLSQSES